MHYRSMLPLQKNLSKFSNILVNEFILSYSEYTAMSRENLSLVVCDQVRLKSVCSATETSQSLEILNLQSTGDSLYLKVQGTR